MSFSLLQSAAMYGAGLSNPKDFWLLTIGIYHTVVQSSTRHIFTAGVGMQ